MNFGFAATKEVILGGRWGVGVWLKSHIKNESSSACPKIYKDTLVKHCSLVVKVLVNFWRGLLQKIPLTVTSG